VYGYVVKPAGAVPGRRYPIAFLIHGGPQVSFQNQWNWRWNAQTYAGRGYAVVTIDFHGSPGYGQAFTDLLGRGATNLLRRSWKSPDEFTQWLYVSALCRPPSPAELKVAQALLGPRLTEQGVADLLWAVCMLPEFQTIR
jgi:hypothetical protein